MFAAQAEYEVKTIDYRSYNERSLIHELRSQFARGNQARVEHSEETIKDVLSIVPKTNWDRIKEVIVGWDPTLDFGWLSPQYIKIESRVKVNIQNTYYNVVPLPVGQREQRIYAHRFRDHYPWGDGEDLMLNWLDAEPPTAGEIETARDKHREWMTGEQGAWLMMMGGGCDR